MKTEAPKGERSCSRPPGQQRVTGHSGLVPALLGGRGEGGGVLPIPLGLVPFILSPSLSNRYFWGAPLAPGILCPQGHSLPISRCGPGLRPEESPGGLSSQSLGTALRGTGPSSAQSLGPPFLSQGTQDTAPPGTPSAPGADVAPGSSSSHVHTAPYWGAFTPQVPIVGLCPQYQAMEGHMGLPNLGLSQKRELSPALKDSP